VIIVALVVVLILRSRFVMIMNVVVIGITIGHCMLITVGCVGSLTLCRAKVKVMMQVLLEVMTLCWVKVNIMSQVVLEVVTFCVFKVRLNRQKSSMRELW